MDFDYEHFFHKKHTKHSVKKSAFSFWKYFIKRFNTKKCFVFSERIILAQMLLFFFF